MIDRSLEHTIDFGFVSSRNSPVSSKSLAVSIQLAARHSMAKISIRIKYLC